jgi:hypothetical protein
MTKKMAEGEAPRGKTQEGENEEKTTTKTSERVWITLLVVSAVVDGCGG